MSRTVTLTTKEANVIYGHLRALIETEDDYQDRAAIGRILKKLEISVEGKPRPPHDRPIAGETP